MTKAKKDLIYSSLAVMMAFILTLYLNLNERFVMWAAQHEAVQVDEIPLILLTGALAAVWFGHRRMKEVKEENIKRIEAEVQVQLLLEENKQLARHAMQAQENERRRLVRELHDDLGQYLTAIRLDAASIPKHGVAAITAHGERIAEHTKHIQHAFRAITQRMRPLSLDHHGLKQAITQLLSEWSNAHSHVTLHTQINTSDLLHSDDVGIAIYRMVQEGMTNISKHSKANNVNLVLKEDLTQGLITISLTNNGVSSYNSIDHHGIGLIAMRERVEALGGHLKISTFGQNGFGIYAVIPTTKKNSNNA